MISLSPVLGLESCWPRYPPAETSIPALRAGSAASRTLLASSSSRSPDDTFSARLMYAVFPSFVIWSAPCWENGLTTDCTYWFCDSDLAVSSTACLFCPSARELSDCRTIGTLPLACSGRYLSSRSVADCEPVPGSVTSSFSGRPTELASTTRPMAITTQAATIHGARLAAKRPSRCSSALTRGILSCREGGSVPTSERKGISSRGP